MPEPSASPNRLRPVFIGPHGVRAGWRFALFAAIVTVVVGVIDKLAKRYVHGDVAGFFVHASTELVVLLGAAAVMGRLEGRRIADYGLPRGTMLRPRFWQGAAVGIGAISLLLLALATCGAFRITGLALHGAMIPLWPAAYVLVFLLVGFREEFQSRGYPLFTLTSGLGFWAGALLTSAYFAWTHVDNKGENVIGVVNVGIYAIVACVMLRRTGDLAMPIGFHFAWDWGETYLYGVPNSGRTAPGQLVHTVAHGPAWLTGGSVGPEGSVLCTALLGVLAMLCVAWLPVTRWPTAEAIEGRGDAPFNRRPDPAPAGTPSPTSLA